MCVPQTVSVVFDGEYEGISNCVVYLLRQLKTRFVRISCDRICELFLEAIRILDGKLLGALDEMAMVEVGLDPPHSRSEAMLAVFAITVTSLRRTALGKNLIGRVRIIGFQVAAFPVP